MDTNNPTATPPAPQKPTPKWVQNFRNIMVVVILLIGGMIWFGHKSMMGTKYAATTKESVNYSGTATEQDAKALGEELKKIGFFDGSSEKDVLFHKDKDGTVTSFVLTGTWENKDTVDNFTIIGRQIAQDLSIQPLTIRLIDDHLNTKKEIKVN